MKNLGERIHYAQDAELVAFDLALVFEAICHTNHYILDNS
jgi:hypothetical protein